MAAAACYVKLWCPKKVATCDRCRDLMSLEDRIACFAVTCDTDVRWRSSYIDRGCSLTSWATCDVDLWCRDLKTIGPCWATWFWMWCNSSRTLYFWPNMGTSRWLTWGYFTRNNVMYTRHFLGIAHTMHERMHRIRSEHIEAPHLRHSVLDLHRDYHLSWKETILSQNRYGQISSPRQINASTTPCSIRDCILL